MAKNSIRYRILRSELEALQNDQRLQESVRLGPGDKDVFTYELQVAPQAISVAVHFEQCIVRVQLSSKRLSTWAREDQVGIYEEIPFGDESLELVLEKDFACLDRSDADNQDTFDNPLACSVC